MLAPLAGMAADIQYPIPCYRGDELAKVQQWEKTWAGKKIYSATVDKVKEFLPETFYNLMKETNKWGENWFEIVPYREVPVTPGNIKFTKQYYCQTKTTPEGEITGYVSGVPFPETTEALEMAHNFRTRSYGDSYKSVEKGYIVDGRLNYDMSIEVRNNMCFFAARTDTPPAPELIPNPKGIWRSFFLEQIDPPEVRDLKILEIHYIDRMKPYDRYKEIVQITNLILYNELEGKWSVTLGRYNKDPTTEIREILKSEGFVVGSKGDYGCEVSWKESGAKKY